VRGSATDSQRAWIERRRISGGLALRNRALLEAAEIELLERDGRIWTVRKLPPVPPPSRLVQPRPAADRHQYLKRLS
jgi:hypothetical protein